MLVPKLWQGTDDNIRTNQVKKGTFRCRECLSAHPLLHHLIQYCEIEPYKIHNFLVIDNFRCPINMAKSSIYTIVL